MRATDYLEPKLIRAKSEKFSFSIPRFVLKDVHSGKISEPEGISTEDLKNSIQASEAQITEMLKMSGAIDRMGWKIFTDIDSLCVDISKALDSESSNLEEVNLQELIDTINYVEEVWPVWAIKHALFCIGSPNEGKTRYNLNNYCSLHKSFFFDFNPCLEINPYFGKKVIIQILRLLKIL